MSNIVNEFRAELASAHLQAQVGRFVRLAVVTFGAQLAALGTGHLSRDALAGVAVGAVEAAYRQWAPVVPWAAIAARLHLLAAQQPSAVAPTPASVPGPAAVPAAPQATVTAIKPPVSGE
ncbi:hypothetical protein [Streptacidiphilus albus]|uniref:hypothetical protein n=1 Tax=Streptacidiphilus albus TaxID=105425 RepID=UPI00054C5CE8|nr:hypothetical protein [Streptacidiphilus albus]